MLAGHELATLRTTHAWSTAVPLEAGSRREQLIYKLLRRTSCLDDQQYHRRSHHIRL